MKALLVILILLFLGLQYRLWVGEGSVAQVTRLKQQIALQQEENQRLILKNKHLAAEVDALRNGYDAIEKKAREELGLVKEGETFFLFVENEESSAK